MFNNIGKKIKIYTSVIFYMNVFFNIVAGGIVFGLGLTNKQVLLMVIGVIIGVVGTFLAWISSFVLYAYGQMSEDIHFIREYIANEDEESTD